MKVFALNNQLHQQNCSAQILQVLVCGRLVISITQQNFNEIKITLVENGLKKDSYEKYSYMQLFLKPNKIRYVY